MVKYLKTLVNVNLIEALLRRYLKINGYMVTVPTKLAKYLKDEYKINFQDILVEVLNNVRVSRVKDSLVQVYIKDKKMGDTTLGGLLELLEYGNRNIQPPKIMTKLFNKSLLQVKSYLGGE